MQTSALCCACRSRQPQTAACAPLHVGSFVTLCLYNTMLTQMVHCRALGGVPVHRSLWQVPGCLPRVVQIFETDGSHLMAF